MSDIPSASNSPSSSPSSSGAIDRIREEANRRAREFESQSESAAGSLKEQAQSTVQSVGEEAAGLASDLKSRALDYAETGKRSGAERLGSFAGAVERAASEIEKDAPETAHFIQKAAQGTQRFSNRLRDRSINDLASDARDVARRQPLLVFGGAVVAGLILARFLKSSEKQTAQSDLGRADLGQSDFGRSDFEQEPRRYGGRHDFE